jgi:FMN-dependent oxidoreductase (nitrilotriacetate monooxygenase family)
MILGAFNMVEPNHDFPTWRLPDGRSGEWDDIRFWKRLARVLEDGGFDFLFFADTYGYPQVDGEIPQEVVTEGIMFPSLDPVVFAAAIADATEHIGIVVTSSTMTELPYSFARRFATLDRLSEGRIGWNVVTGTAYGTLGEMFGLGPMAAHDDRYARAQEYVDLTTTLWEQSWDDDAWRNDPDTVLIDPAKVRPVTYTGEYLATKGMFTTPPTTQRTPTLFQAGASPRGRDFAARVAEGIFVSNVQPEAVRGIVDDIRARAVAHGRRGDDIRMMTSAIVIVGATDEEAQEKRRAIEANYTYDVAAVWYAGFTGIDLRGYAPDEPLDELSTEEGQGDLALWFADGKRPTPREIIEDFLQSNGDAWTFVGTADTIAEQMIERTAVAGLDGLMISPTFGNEKGYEEFVEWVVPELRARGALPEPRARTSLRNRLFPEGGDRLNDRHPNSRARAGA